MASDRLVWFLLVDGEGKAYKGTTADYVSISSGKVIAQFRDAVHGKNSGILSGIVPAQLLVYANKAAFEANTADSPTVLRSSSPLDGLGNDEDNAVCVVVPEQVHSGVSKKPRLEKEIFTFSGTGTRVVDPEKWQLNQWINTQAIKNVTDFPCEYFIRKESIDIFQLLKTRTKQIVLVGSPGVGKSLLLVLYSFWVAFEKKEKNSVMLIRKIKGERQDVSVIYLNALDPNKNWTTRMFSIEEAIENGVRYLERNDMLCLDGFKQSDINQHSGLGGFSVLATSAQYRIKSDDSPVLDVCLVPFWSLSDLKQVGTRNNFDATSMEKRYYFSGGNLRSFLLGESGAKNVLDAAFDDVTFDKAELLKTQYGSLSNNQVDHIRMATAKIAELGDYCVRSKWNYVICSGYSLVKLGEIVTLEYFEDLCTKAYAMKDFGLFGVAFENQIHAMARHKKAINLQIRVYDRKRIHHHDYSPMTFRSNTYLLKGDDQAECEHVMRHWPGTVDYWYPSSRSLKTIDCVALLEINGHDEFGLLQITWSKTHPIDPEYLNKIAEWLSPHRYIAVVPTKDICDEFRLDKADPDTAVPLYVAYVDDPFFEQFTRIKE